MLYNPKAAPGITSYTCECGAHSFGFPYDDKLETWETLNASRYRLKFEEAGILSSEPPPPLPHVIMLSPQDREFFKLRRWRVVKSPPGKINAFEVAGSVRGRRLHRMLLPDAEVIQFVNVDGTDLRRENLIRTNMREVCRERDQRRRAAQALDPPPPSNR